MTNLAARRRITFGFERFSGLYLWAGFIVVFGFWKPSLFLSTHTVHSIASDQAVSAILALAVLVPLVTGTFDLSAGATANMTAILAITAQSNWHWDMWTAIIVGVGAGVAVGLVNGFVVVKLRVGSFIATLGMATILSAVQAIVSNNSQPSPPARQLWSTLTTKTVFGFQIIVVYLVVIAIVVWWALDHTPAGRYMYAIGGNAEAARLSAVKVGKWTWLSLIFGGGIAGFAGVAYGSLAGPALNFGPSLLLPAFAATFLGATQLTPGRFNVWGTLIAVYALATGVKGLQLVTGVPWLSDMFNGVALIAAVSFAAWRTYRAGRLRRRRPDAAPPSPPSTGGTETAPRSERSPSDLTTA